MLEKKPLVSSSSQYIKALGHVVSDKKILFMFSVKKYVKHVIPGQDLFYTR